MFVLRMGVLHVFSSEVVKEHKTFIELACSIHTAKYCSHSIFASLWTDEYGPHTVHIITNSSFSA